MTAVEAELVVSATGVRPDSRLAAAAGLDTKNGRIVVDERMHTSALNVYAAGDVALAYNITAGRRIPAEHWRDATQQGRIAGQSPRATRRLGRGTRILLRHRRVELKYRGWGAGYEHSSLVEHRDGFTVALPAGSEVVGVLTATTNPAA